VSCAYGRLRHGPGYLRAPCDATPAFVVVIRCGEALTCMETCARHRDMLHRYLRATGTEDSELRWVPVQLH
jgi:hypothetical protein